MTDDRLIQIRHLFLNSDLDRAATGMPRAHSVSTLPLARLPHIEQDGPAVIDLRARLRG